MSEFDLPVKTVTCHTDGCENADVEITLPCADSVSCGVCNQPITDIKDPVAS